MHVLGHNPDVIEGAERDAHVTEYCYQEERNSHAQRPAPLHCTDVPRSTLLQGKLHVMHNGAHSQHTRLDCKMVNTLVLRR